MIPASHRGQLERTSHDGHGQHAGRRRLHEPAQHPRILPARGCMTIESLIADAGEVAVRVAARGPTADSSRESSHHGTAVRGRSNALVPGQRRQARRALGSPRRSHHHAAARRPPATDSAMKGARSSKFGAPNRRCSPPTPDSDRADLHHSAKADDAFRTAIHLSPTGSGSRCGAG
jgi:hypothetical protein